MQTLPTYSQLIESAIVKFMRVLSETEPQFVSESAVQQLRKKALEIVQRSTSIWTNVSLSNEQRVALIRDILLLVFRLVEKENEENSVVCLKIITDYQRLLKSMLTNEVSTKLH